METTIFRSVIRSLIKNKHLVFLFLVPITNLLFTPLQTRLIDPALLGTYSAYISLIGLLIAFSSCKTETLILHAQNETEQIDIGKTSIHLLKFSTVFFTVFLSVFWYYYSSKNISQTISVLVITPFILFSSGVDAVSRIFLIRNGVAEYYYKLSFFRNLIKNISIIFLPGLILAQLFTLLISEVSGRLMAFGKQFKTFALGTVKPGVIKWVFDNRKTTFYYSLSLFVNSVTASIPLLFIQNHNPTDGGIYSMFYRLFCIPSMLIATFFADKLSASENSSAKSQKKILLALVVLSTLLFLFMQFTPESVYLLFLGKSWGSLANVVSALSLSVCLEMLFSAISIIFVLQRIMVVKYWFDGIYIVITILPFIIFSGNLQSELFLLNILRSCVTLFFIILIVVRLNKSA